ncbi:MAG: D-alanyl-D-alanine carboxypeptidase family protein [Alphaproteobacteria bacterium]
MIKNLSCSFILALSLIVFLTTGVAMASTIYRTSSSIIVDAENKNVIYADNADSLAYPASLTKTMTLLLLFDKLENGDWQPNTMLKVSRNAARRPKTRLGVRPGDRVSVDLAIRSIVVLSANDIAVVVAENIAGTERAFANRMTKKAKAIGMKQTSFRNASGLSNRRQVTTARDMALLGVYILNNYPQYYHYFSINNFRFKKRVIKTHNRLLERFNGADGFKTGYISRSGYNLLTSAERDGKRVVAVVLGGGTASHRDSMMSYLLDRYLPYASVYSRSFELFNLKTSNRQPQLSLEKSYKRYVKKKKKKKKKKKLAEDPHEKKLRIKRQKDLAEAKKRKELHSQLLVAGEKRTTNKKTADKKKSSNDEKKKSTNKEKKTSDKKEPVANNKNKKIKTILIQPTAPAPLT